MPDVERDGRSAGCPRSSGLPFLSWKPLVGCGIRRLSDHISPAGAVCFCTLAIFVVDKWPGQKETAPAYGDRLRPPSKPSNWRRGRPTHSRK